jgi:hypothetical protein
MERETMLFIKHFIAALGAVWNAFKGTTSLKCSILEGVYDSSPRL